MSKVIRGKAYVVRDNIDTDQIIPAQYLTLVPTIPGGIRETRQLRDVRPAEGPVSDPLHSRGANQGTVHNCHRRAQFRLWQFARACADCPRGGGMRGGGGGKFCANLLSQQRGHRRTLSRGIHGANLRNHPNRATKSNSIWTRTRSRFSNPRRFSQPKSLGDARPVIDAGGLFDFARQSGMIQAQGNHSKATEELAAKEPADD